jgi:hypothetical protein
VQEPPGGRCIPVLQGLGRGWITDLALAGSRLFVASNRESVHVWDIGSQYPDAMLFAHDARECRVKPLVVSEGTLFHVSFATVKLWSVATLKYGKIISLGVPPSYRRRGLWRTDKGPLQ